MKNGWHRLQGYDVAVEDGKVVRATMQDSNGGRIPAAAYRWSNRNNCWVNAMPISAAAFSAGLRRGTISVK